MLSKRVVKFNPSVCVACGACIKECPRSAIYIYKGCYAQGKAELCVGCGKCVKICPTGCIEIQERQEINEKALV